MSAAADLLANVNAALAELGYDTRLVSSCTVTVDGLMVESLALANGKPIIGKTSRALITESTFHPFTVPIHGAPD